MAGEFEQRVVPLVVGWLVVADQLDHDVVAAKHVGERAQRLLCLVPSAPVGKRGGDGALAAAGQYDPVPVVRRAQLVQVIVRPALLPTSEMGGADHLAQPPVAIGITGENEQVITLWIGYSCAA